MTRQKLHLLCAVSLAAIAAVGPASAQTVSKDKIDAMEEQIAALQRELKSIKSKVNTTEKTAEKAYAAATPASKAPAPAPSAIVKMSAGNRPSICTTDGLNCIAFTSRLHLDVGGYSYDPNTLSTVPQHLDAGVNARRARIGVLGTFMGDWNYALIYDFGGSSDGFGGTVSSNGGVTTGLLPGGAASGIQNAYLSYQGIKGLAIEGGYMDALYTLDEATSSNDIMFMERASSQVIASNIAAGDNRSMFGARWYNEWLWVGAYVTGPTSGAIHSGSSTTPNGATEQYGGFARVAMQLVNEKDFTFHIGGDVQFLFKPPFNRVTGAQNLTLSDRPELRIDPTAILSTGTIASVSGAQVYSVEAAASYGPLYFQGEYFWFNVDRLAFTNLPSRSFSGGYVQASWTLTGEQRAYNAGNAAYNGVVPANPFSFSRGGWGAWEIAARYSVMDLNDDLGIATGVAGGKQTVYTVGLNWYVNRNIRFMVNYLHADIDKQLSPTNITDVGASFDAVAMRTQIAF
jgi:phosphate-selective porin OprO/OprP